jgi:lysophospholipase L1-like esterase
MLAGLSKISAILILSVPALCGAADSVVDAFETSAFNAPKEKGRFQIVEGKEGKAVKFSFDDACKSSFFMRKLKGAPEWDSSEGFSFWLKGDGSDHSACMQFLWNEDYKMRYEFAFSLKSTEWKKVYVPWTDLVPVLSHEGAKLIDMKNGILPSKLSQMWIGKWWAWRDCAAHSFTIDDMRIEAKIEQDRTDYRPKDAPLARMMEKLKAGKPVTIVTMGDSLTDYNHWANKPVNWPTLLKEQLKAKYKSEVTIVNPAIGGTELRQNVVMIPNWLVKTPEPDLITVCFGGNDWNGGMRGEGFFETMKYTVERLRRETKGAADVLLITTAPWAKNFDEFAPLADGVRRAAADRNAGLADLYNAFHESGKSNKEQLYAKDLVHLSPAGHDVVAKTVLQAIESGGK